MFLLCGYQRHLSAYFKSIVDLIYGLINSLNSDEKMSVEGEDNDGYVKRANDGKL